jgi:hypothetical protein
MVGLGGWSRDIACSRLRLRRRRAIAVFGSAEGAAGGLANFDFSGTTTGTLKGKPFQETFNGSRSQHGWLGGGQIGIQL